ncbi:hypothetical protein [Rhodococcus qingshengii]|uniref:hypothetical protein n=1 Tax=Rhodococcus qingshengii TaxID=334542 RepID=UPI001C5CFC13|nr:hypothetical protein [Rhodococcus qingshengii]MBW4818361.1 hypothetical protein [Rhodococcus qingshengii]
MIHNIFRKTTALTLGLVTATAIVAACGTDGDTYDPAPTSTQQPVLTGPEGSLKSPEQQATEAAIAKSNEFFAVLAKVENDPATDINVLDTVASGKILEQLKNSVTLRRSQGIVGSGAATVIDATSTKVEAPKDADGTPIAEPATVSLRVCVDTSNYEQRRPDGTSVLDPSRSMQELGKPTLENPRWPDASGWRVVSDAVTKSGTPCDAP